MKILCLFGIIAALFFLGDFSQSEAASFDCKRASTNVERTICNNDDLSRLDAAMGQEFKEKLNSQNRSYLLENQREWLRERDEFCSIVEGNDFPDCLKYKTRQRLLDLVYLGSPVPRVVAYGSRAGMVMTVVAARGIGTSRAVIQIEHTWENAQAFCVEYGLTFDQDCPRETVAEIEAEYNLPDNISANCRTGEFVSMYGRATFLGPDPGSSYGEYLIMVDRAIIDTSTASGYGVFINNFAALCPHRVR